jgi:DeoR/GlpR family transcriptional regulator of sugar metabolism
VQVRDLVDQFGVSEMTIRRDLEQLGGEGRLLRTYGGARTPGQTIREQPYAAKAVERIAEKGRIARRAAELVSDGDVILLDAGSTTAALARSLRGRKNLTVVTVDLKIGLELCDEPGIRVMVTGGTAQPGGYNLYGPIAEMMLRGLTVDLAFIGTSAIDLEQGLTTPNLDKVRLKQAMLRAARRSVVLADAGKFGLRANFQIAPLKAISLIITDTGLPAEMARVIRKEGVDLDLL